MGYFERCGKISGPTSIDIFCAPTAIDDMLKSLLVLNLGGGRAGAVTYDSSKTTEMRFEDFGFDLRDCRGLADLVAVIKGTPVKVSVSGQSVSGRVLGLDEIEQIVGDKTVKENQLVLFTQDSIIKRYNFSAITSLHVEDEGMASEIKQQLELLFDKTKKKDSKRLKVAIEGTATREIFIAYSIPSPIWKTSYRLVFVPDGTLLLQGMAIVDNVQEEDWTNVQMVLVSAAPISFIQPLYDPIQPPRPVVAPQGVLSAGPVLAERAQREEAMSSPRAKQMLRAAAPPPSPGAPVPAQADSWGSTPSMFAQSMSAGASLSGAMQATIQEAGLPVETEDSGELFEYKISKPVSVPQNSSALIPLVQQTIEGERISLYNARKNSRFPFCSVQLKNTTDLTLESGPVTVMEEHAYAGEAMLDVLKPNDTRLLPYALDHGCHVIVRADTTRKPVWRVRVAYGIIYMDYVENYKTNYQVENLTDRQKVVLVEHPILPGMRLADGQKPIETSQSYHRFRVDLKPGKKATLEVVEETDYTFHVRLDNVEAIDPRQLDWLLQQNYVDKKLLDFLHVVMKERAELLSLLELKRNLETQIAQYKADQERARSNVKTLGTASDRYRQAIDEAEDKILQAQDELNSLLKTISERQMKFAELARAELSSELEHSGSGRS
jgi:hypothetical protein